MDINAMTQGERYAALSDLLKLHAGAVRLDGDTWCAVFSEEIPCGTSRTVTAFPQIDFQPRKLVILEPVVQVVERETVYTNVLKRSGLFGRKQEIVHAVDRIIEHVRYEPIQRGIWRVRSALVGQRLQFPMQCDISGDAFGPDGELLFKDKCHAALSISMTVHNDSLRASPFIAVLLGTAEDGAWNGRGHELPAE